MSLLNMQLAQVYANVHMSYTNFCGLLKYVWGKQSAVFKNPYVISLSAALYIPMVKSYTALVKL